LAEEKRREKNEERDGKDITIWSGPEVGSGNGKTQVKGGKKCRKKKPYTCDGPRQKANHMWKNLRKVKGWD